MDDLAPEPRPPLRQLEPVLTRSAEADRLAVLLPTGFPVPPSSGFDLFRNLLYLLRFIMLLFTISKLWEAVRWFVWFAQDGSDSGAKSVVAQNISLVP